MSKLPSKEVQLEMYAQERTLEEIQALAHKMQMDLRQEMKKLGMDVRPIYYG